MPIAFCLAPRVSYVQRHLEYNATGGTRIKSTARRLPPLREWTREAKKSIAACRRSVSPELPFQVRWPSRVPILDVDVARESIRQQLFPPVPPEREKYTDRGRGRGKEEGKHLRQRALSLSRFGKLKRKVGVDRSTCNGTFNLLVRGEGDYASGSSWE